MILSLLDKVTAQNITIEIEWIPSLVGIPGNEAADVTAKPGMNFGIIDNTLPSKAEVYPLINHVIMNKWQDLRDLNTKRKTKKKKNNNTGKAYRLLQPTVKKTATQYSSIRKHDIVYTHLRLGLNRLKANPKVDTEDVHMQKMRQTPTQEPDIMSSSNAT